MRHFSISHAATKSNGGPANIKMAPLMLTLANAAPPNRDPTRSTSPESNGMAEAFVNTIKRDYVGGADLSDAEIVIKQLPGWIHDYNRFAPHSALGFLSPHDFPRPAMRNLRCLNFAGQTRA